MDDSTTTTSTTQLQPRECWDKLRSTTLGRLAVLVDQRPDIFPVNYVVDHGTVVFRTDAGTKLAAILDEPTVAFEVDGQDHEICWSVVLKGRARRISKLHESIEAAGLPLYPHQGGPKSNVIELVVDDISGRQFPRADPMLWTTALTGRARAASE
jgi:uncharacterized protein